MKEEWSLKENVIESYLRNEVKAIGGKAYKFVSPGNAGVPDRIVILPDGRVVFIELKASGKTSTSKQIKMQTELRGFGCKVLVIDSKEKVDDFILSVK